MKFYLKKLILKFSFIVNFFLLICSTSFADNHNIYETLEQIQKDIKTLEKAVYSSSAQLNNINNNSSSDNSSINSEDVLTRHLLKLSEIENQFQQLTNKFEEINFKLDKLSNRMSKVQSDNQLRFQDLESSLLSDGSNKKIVKKTKEKNDEDLPGSSQPQDLGSISYKDTATNETTQQTQSNDTTELVPDIVTDNVVLYLDASNKSSYPGTGTVWHDLSPNQNDGLISGTTFSSNGGEGFIFGGSSSDYITVADDTSLDMDNNQMTISYEITPDLNGSNWSPAIQKGVSATACGVGTLNYYTWYGNNDLKKGAARIVHHNDHRIVMSFYVANLICIKSNIIIDKSSVKTSYPDFFKHMSKNSN